MEWNDSRARLLSLYLQIESAAGASTKKTERARTPIYADEEELFLCLLKLHGCTLSSFHRFLENSSKMLSSNLPSTKALHF
jgi:hypothetical protein